LASLHLGELFGDRARAHPGREFVVSGSHLTDRVYRFEDMVAGEAQEGRAGARARWLA